MFSFLAGSGPLRSSAGPSANEVAPGRAGLQFAVRPVRLGPVRGEPSTVEVTANCLILHSIGTGGESGSL